MNSIMVTMIGEAFFLTLRSYEGQGQG